MRVEAIAWLLGGLLALAAGVVSARQEKRGAKQASSGKSSFYLAAAALLCVLVALGRQVMQAGAWPSGAASEGLALLAGGGLGCVLWQGGRRRTGLAGGLVAAGLSLLAAAALGWSAPAAGPVPQARTWLFGLRGLLAGLGLGGWLLIGAATLQEGGRDLAGWARESFGPPAGLPPAGKTEPRAPAANAAAGETDGNRAAGEGAASLPAPTNEAAAATSAAAAKDAVAATAGREVSAAGAGLAGTQARAGGEDETPAQAALAALSFSYPWLTAAVAAAGLWNAVAFATPWRSRPADLWLAAAWLIGAACLHLASRREGSRLYPALLRILALCGLAASVLAALQAPTLLL